jgi:hypothetical protein
MYINKCMRSTQMHAIDVYTCNLCIQGFLYNAHRVNLLAPTTAIGGGWVSMKNQGAIY